MNRKRFLALLCTLVLLTVSLLPMAALASSKRYVYTSNGKSLNMRKAPITHANNKIANIPYGASVTVENFVDGGTWAYIKYDGKHGYVMSRYLVTKKPAARKSEPASAKTDSDPSYKQMEAASYDVLVRAHTPGGYVNLRWAPSTSSPVQEKVTDGSLLHVIAQNSSWAQVQDPATGLVGFMLRSFLTVSSTIGEGASAN